MIGTQFVSENEYKKFVHEWDTVRNNILKFLTKNNMSIILVPDDYDNYVSNKYKTEWRRNRKNDRNNQ